ncbi:ectonucleoside triphosphate diphosphohydrolase 1 isoform X2 [Histomonas meleagridis]|uniref:ectonucleoside triphosphate diphosphohydrolase 1 isoform X2 n=1 Tax=Histomonas meleagridis TaxID=135588 RepID=UPI003559EDDD|nr:ectonucleoside triphosphate diphosphohydrolase 1 isoform X2 [Histomonas meleagridis]KAH0805036.1 ectonucleoside triphosphate diphosphohydrolase 1 isoform X2 [Histomonas meleagridis]
MLCVLFAFAFGNTKYGIVIDAGSTGTRVNIYSYNQTQNDAIPELKTIAYQKFSLRLSDVPKNKSLTKAIGDKVIEVCLKYIPKDLISETRLMLLATAGVRGLSQEDQKTVMNDIYQYLRSNCEFKFVSEDVRVLSDADEGIFGWICTNYLYRTFQNEKDTYGAVDMGGASLELTYQLHPSIVSSENRYNVKVGKTYYNVFSYSYLGYGQEKALDAVVNASRKEGTRVEVPCYFKDYQEVKDGVTYVGTGNVNECSKQIDDVLIRDPKFASIYLPQPNATKHYIPFSTFTYVIQDFMKLPDDFKLSHFTEYLVKINGTAFSEISKEHSDIDPNYLSAYFFDIVYCYKVLAEGFGLSDLQQTFASPKKVNGVEIGWAMGAMLNDIFTIEIKKQFPLYGYILIAVGVVVLVSIIIIVVIFIKKKGSKNGFKSYEESDKLGLQ